MSEAARSEPAQICAPTRDVDDRLGEALRRLRFGIIRPLWNDMPEAEREGWCNMASSFRVSTLRDVGLKVEVDE